MLSKWIAPADPDEQGLASALDELASYNRMIFDIRCSFRCDEIVSIKNENATTNPYRIAQEAVSNEVRHSGAWIIEISLIKRDNSVIMTVRDNGAGLDDSLRTSGGMGIKIMNYRAGIIGAAVTISAH